MRTKLILSLSLAFGVAAVTPLVAQEARTSPASSSSVERRSVPTPPSASLIEDRNENRNQESYRVAMTEPVRAGRCDNLLCPMYVVLGSGF